MLLSDLMENQEHQVIPGNEAILDLKAFNNFFGGFIDSLTKVFDAKRLTPLMQGKTDVYDAVKNIEKCTVFDLEHFIVPTPEYVVGLIVPYLTVLEEVTTELLTIDDRLLTHLEQWAGNMITDKEYVNKVWINMPEKSNIVEVNSDKLHKYFSDAAGDGLNGQLFINVYKDAKGLKEADVMLEKLVALSCRALNGKLIERANSVAKMIHRLSNDNRVDSALSQVTADKLKPITELTIQAARELELLAICLFQIRTVSYAYNETLTKINVQMK